MGVAGDQSNATQLRRRRNRAWAAAVGEGGEQSGRDSGVDARISARALDEQQHDSRGVEHQRGGPDDDSGHIHAEDSTNAMVMALQPIINLTTGQFEDAEALARFADGIGPPDAVFASAYQVGLGEALEELAARNAVAQLAHLSDDRYLPVNLSPAVAFDLATGGINTWHVPFHRLVIEITEKASVESYTGFAQRLEALRDQGLRLAIDHAGAGYGSLRHIAELEPDIIKNRPVPH